MQTRFDGLSLFFAVVTLGCGGGGGDDGGSSTQPASTSTAATDEPPTTSGTTADATTSGSAPTETGSETSAGDDCSFAGLTERTLQVDSDAMLWGPNNEGLILEREIEGGDGETTEIVVIDFCGEVQQTLLPSKPTVFFGHLALNDARTRLYYTEFNQADFIEHLLWLPYPSGGAGTLVGALELQGDPGVDPQEKFTLYAGGFGLSYRLDYSAPDTPMELDITPSAVAFAVAPDGQSAAFKDDEGDIYIFDVASNTKTFAVAGPTINIYPIRWVGTRIYHLLQVDHDETIRAYNTATQTTEDIVEIDFNFSEFTVSPDEAWIAFGGGYEVAILAI